MPFKRIVTYGSALLLFALTAFICFYQLGHSFLENWDEGLYAEVVKQILISKDFIAMRWNNELYLDKPPLYYWITAIIAYVFGLNELTVRIFPAICGFLTILITTLFAYKKWGLFAGFAAWSALALNNLFIWRARTGNLDTPVVLGFLLVFLLLLWKSRYKYVLLGILFGILFLQKASIVTIPVIALLIYEIFWSRLSLKSRVLLYPTVILPAFAIVGLWFLATYVRLQNFEIIDYFMNRSDQGVSKIAMEFMNVDYVLHVYYSLQRRLIYPLLIGIVGSFMLFRNPRHALLLYFGLSLPIFLSFTERNNNWYLLPSLPFLAILVGYGFYICIKITGKFIPKKIVITVLGLLLLYISYKTFTVNIMPIINQTTNIAEVRTARFIKSISNKKDKVLRVDHAYPVTMFYGDRESYAYDGGDGNIIEAKGIRWVAGKKDDVLKFMEIDKRRKFKKFTVGEELVLERIL